MIFRETPTGLRQVAEVAATERSRNIALEIERDTVMAERDAAQAEIEKLRLLIRQLQRNRFGRRSEKLDPDQLQLGLEDLEQTAAVAGRRGGALERGAARDPDRGLAVAPASASRDPSPEHGLLSGSPGVLGFRPIE